jgi:tripeptidyl-peptidase-1
MIISLLILLFIFNIQSLLVIEGTTITSSHVFKESVRGLSMRKDLKKTSRASAHLHHTVIFAVQQRNLDELEQVLFDISDPKSSNYGKHWSKSEVGELTSNPISTNAVLEYLSFKEVNVVNQSLYGEYITATTTIKVWEDMFNTEFHYFDMKLQSVDGEAKIVQVIRAESYSLPVELSDHVSAVFKTVQT